MVDSKLFSCFFLLFFVSSGTRIISFFILMALLSALGGNTETSTNSASTISESTTPAPEVSETPGVEATPTESTSPTPIPMSPVEFRVSALGDVADMRKDFSDFEVVLGKGGLLRLMGNILEIEFNIGQLQALTPPDQYSVKFSEKLLALDAAVDGLSSAVTDAESSTSNTKNWLSKSRSALNSLEAFLKSVD